MRLERGFRIVLAAEFQCLWLLSALLAQLKEDGYQPSDYSLFDENISSLSAALDVQTPVTGSFSDLINSKRRGSCLSHSSLTLADSR